MSLGKKDIALNITSKALFSFTLSKAFLESFISIIKKPPVNSIKISNFGVFFIKESPERVGRNPRTGEEFKISCRKKLTFKASNSVKTKLN